MLLERKEIQKTYGKQLLLKDIHLSIPKGQAVAIIGGNGTGKSTLLKMIASIRLKKEMPELLWVFPPINSFLMFGQYEHHLLVHVLLLTAWALAYSFVLMSLFLYLVRKRRNM
ncbi:ABC transporter permease [Bacillus pseudomycoides]|uniref:ATP-binding cassette domain-containing protein n=1 Tax=Bacillus pseudomycoides TaxID=64104 RepID=A0AAJ1YYI3_9BACI|nr:ABC transporter, permease [Bacillus pseudomycoides]KFN13851.1 ABC transporter family protein [Bacillus pseudomycoides]MBD5795132.1 ABC transporter permease [Bacillus pseudomycoides]MDR4186386.1 ATP-binding cassette domain-containing protein [Bacillus pseudomycoides]MDR4325158.1 ATP-binding cassette domain-containing protein [Bacillus pseudomycoides]